MTTVPFQARFPDRLLLPLRFDPQRLAADLEALSDVTWTEHFVRQNYEGDWSAIPLRAAEGATHPIMMIFSSPAATVFVDTPCLARSPYLREALASFGCPLQCVRLMRLAPGSAIKEHSDGDLAFEYGFARLHIPIVTNPDAAFWLNGRRVTMEPGSLWYLRLSDPHRAINAGAADRVHLVLDVVVNDWLERLLCAAEQAALRASVSA